MVQRAMALAVSRCLPNCLIDVVPCPRHRFRQGQALGEAGSDGRGCRAAGAVGVRVSMRGEAKASVPAGVARQVGDGVGAFQVAALISTAAGAPRASRAWRRRACRVRW